MHTSAENISASERANFLFSIPQEETRGPLIFTKIDSAADNDDSSDLAGALLNGPIEVGKSIHLVMNQKTTVVEGITKDEKGPYIIKTIGSTYKMERVIKE
jgi:hypothetical protein